MNSEREALEALADVTAQSATAPAKPAWVLQKLTARHRRIVQLKVAGLAREDIARVAGVRPEYISMLLGQELVQAYLAEQHKALDEDLRDLMGPAVQTLRSTLTSPDDKVALASAQTVLKVNGKFSGADAPEGATAEDVVAALFNMRGPRPPVVAVQINNSVAAPLPP